jgi:hypothetical protein
MANRPSNLKNGFNRRDFVYLALMGSAALAQPGALAWAEAAKGNADHFAQLHPLPPGAVRPEGWLRKHLEKQAAELGSKLPAVSFPFTGNFWAGEEKSDTWWPWEQKGYWLDGATRLAIVLGSKSLMDEVRPAYNYTLSHPDERGYIGPRYLADAKPGCHRWPHTVFFRGVTAVGDAKEIPGGAEKFDIPAILDKHFHVDNKDLYGKPERNVTNIEGMLWTYGRTGDKSLLTLAEESWREFMKTAGLPKNGDLSEERVYGNAEISAHGVTYAETVKLPAILYLYTGKDEYLRFARAAERRIFDHHMLIDGIPSTSEWYRTTTALDSHETCDIADHTWSWGYLLMATGESLWADRIERACFNAAPGAIRPDWKGLQYFSCPNQFLATHTSNHNTFKRGNHWMAYQPNPGWKTACCGGDAHRIFPNYVIRMWMKTNDDGLAAVLYGPSQVSAEVGASKQTVTIQQTTEYPFRDRIEFTVKSSRAAEFPLWLRVPGWCSALQLRLNGKAITGKRNDKGFLVVRRRFQPGDRLTLRLPMQLALSQWPQNGVGIERGPLVYSLPIQTKWTTRVDPQYSTKEYPNWDATPESAWNYALAIDAAKLASEVQVKEISGPVEDPWVHPPTMLTVPVKKIPGWELQRDAADPKVKFTPPLPDLAVTKAAAGTERVVLVPYGATQLRVTIFPSAF